MDILSCSQELGDDEGVDVVGFGFFGQGFPEFVGVVKVEEDDGEPLLFEVGVEVFPESAAGFQADPEVLLRDREFLEAVEEVLEGFEGIL